MMQAYLRKQEKSQISNLNLALKKIQEREQAIGKVRRSKEIIQKKKSMKPKASSFKSKQN